MCRSFYHGLRCSFFDQGLVGNIPYFLASLCSQHGFSAERRYGNHRHACRSHLAANDHSEKNYRLVQLAQLPIAFLFGWLTDFALWSIAALPNQSYPVSCLFCIIGILLVGIGVSFEVNAKLVPLAGEGLILEVCQAWDRPFPQTKIAFDCTLVLLSVFLSLLTMGTIEGVREGTAFAAVFVGLVSKQVTGIVFKHHQQIEA